MSLFFKDRRERFAHDCSFVKSNGGESLTVTPNPAGESLSQNQILSKLFPLAAQDPVCLYGRFLPMLMPKSGDGKATGPDLSTLRTFRVLRPLKLVSGVPSKPTQIP